MCDYVTSLRGILDLKEVIELACVSFQVWIKNVQQHWSCCWMMLMLSPEFAARVCRGGELSCQRKEELGKQII